ncbi:MAG: hypothetical protein VKK59_07030, partial [Vampirovibrionales bacterium]|nr:hypothetical protein [Vampirovibrionales bacterium]
SLAENIRKAIMALKFKEQPSLVVTASFGVATVHFNSPKARNIHQFDDFVKLADDELYKAKLGGRNTVSATVIQQ